MPVFLGIIFTILLFVGFYSLGKFLTKIFKLNEVLVLVSEPRYQYASLGIAFFLFTIYPFFFLEILDTYKDYP